jgi:hypothetical protein
MAKIRLKKRFKEKIPGGLASGKDISSFDADSIKKGVKTELEHTSDIDVATEIAMDHLAEDPLYYDKLEKMEKGVNEMKLKIKKVLKEEVCLDEMCGDMPQNSAAPPDFSGEPDPEGEMADSQMLKVHQYSKELMDMIDDEMQLPSWVQAKLTKVADYMGAVKHYLEGEMALKEAESGLSNPEKADLDNDGELSSYEKKRGAAIEKAMADDKKKDLDESYIIEGECEDDKTMYEVELYSEECGCGALEESLEEAEYRGRKVQLNKPMRGDVKKFKVFVKDPKTGNVKKVNFGDPNMRIKKSNPKRRKSFRARHNCDNPGPKTKARYWSCRKWEE